MASSQVSPAFRVTHSTAASTGSEKPLCRSSFGALDLPAGDHTVRFHVEADLISFEIAASHPSGEASTGQRQPTGFLKKWGSTARGIEDPADAWLTHINEKHVR